jgi:hypothetical protein
MPFAADTQAQQLYLAAVASVASTHRGQAGLFRDPRWQKAERGIETAYQARDTPRFVAAVAAFETASAVVLAEYDATAAREVCLHAEDTAVVLWRTEHPELLCARCWFEAAL